MAVNSPRHLSLPASAGYGAPLESQIERVLASAQRCTLVRPMAISDAAALATYAKSIQVWDEQANSCLRAGELGRGLTGVRLRAIAPRQAMEPHSRDRRYIDRVRLPIACHP